MIAELSIIRLHDLPSDRLAALAGESEAEGFAFMRRLIDDWTSGANRFSRPGEALFGAILGGRIAGICGLNVDPYLKDGRVGRVRHLYVAAGTRRRGVGTRLLAAVIAAADASFDRLRLRTENDSAARFYEAIGFRPSADEIDCTHVLDLAG